MAKADVTYNLSDIGTQVNMLTEKHQAEVARNQMIQQAYKLRAVLPVWDIDKAIKSLYSRVSKHLGTRSKYLPHQGKQEIARRLARVSVVGV